MEDFTLAPSPTRDAISQAYQKPCRLLHNR